MNNNKKSRVVQEYEKWTEKCPILESSNIFGKKKFICD